MGTHLNGPKVLLHLSLIVNYLPRYDDTRIDKLIFFGMRSSSVKIAPSLLESNALVSVNFHREYRPELRSSKKKRRNKTVISDDGWGEKMWC